ncbi:MAG TPA: LysM domain-containing protein [Gaiellales bacterium]|jgi:hypothetical protein
MARASTSSELGEQRRPGRFQWSVWTFVAPVALVVCVLVIWTIARDAGWLHRSHAAPVKQGSHAPSAGSASQTGAAMLYRPRKGDTLTDIAVRFGISLEHLRALNPKVPVTKALPTTRRIRLR